MQKQGTTWRYLAVLAVLANCGPGVFGDAEPDNKDRPKQLSAETAKAWQDAGAELGWMKNVPPESGAHHFWEPWREKGEAGAMPAFRFPERSAGGVLATLPDPGIPFGLDFHCGFYAGVKLKELAALKNLQSLSLGGVQGKAYADLKELAALSDLRGLYLFYLPVTDEQLKNLSGLKNLRTLDLTHTPVTDAGLKELAGLRSLHALNLGQTKVTDAGLKDLAGLKSLQELNLHRTKVTEAGIAALQKELPACKIILSDDSEQAFRRPLPTAGKDKVDKRMTEKDLRLALLRTVSAYPKFFPASLKEETETAPLIKRKEMNGLIDLGSFRCDLEKRVFAYSPGGYWGPDYANGSTRGRFILDEHSEWVGELTGTIRK